ncbi:TPA: hypothetical protein ACNTUM_000883 [Escherichia coli]|nr:hypothetical protein [Escherichia coli]HCO3884060.1 hypothetical protein [Escherichia coli]
MNKLEFCDLPESVQITAVDFLKQQLAHCDPEQWNATAKLIAKAFVTMYEIDEASINIHHGITIVDKDFPVGKTII